MLRDGGDCILLATGSEVPLAQRAADVLSDRGIAARVVSMPSWELFLAQPPEYRDSVLPPAIRNRVSVEAGATLGWHRFVGLDGIAIGIDRFGASAPGRRRDGPPGDHRRGRRRGSHLPGDLIVGPGRPARGGRPGSGSEARNTHRTVSPDDDPRAKVSATPPPSRGRGGSVQAAMTRAACAVTSPTKAPL